MQRKPLLNGAKMVRTRHKYVSDVWKHMYGEFLFILYHD